MIPDPCSICIGASLDVVHAFSCYPRGYVLRVVAVEPLPDAGPPLLVTVADHLGVKRQHPARDVARCCEVLCYVY